MLEKGLANYMQGPVFTSSAVHVSTALQTQIPWSHCLRDLLLEFPSLTLGRGIRDEKKVVLTVENGFSTPSL